jgi:hypothetical protein
MEVVRALHPDVPENWPNEPNLRGAALLGQVTILAEREGRYDAHVPIKLVSSDGVAVDGAHVYELKDLMQKEAEESGGSGQIEPIVLAMLPDHDVFLVTNGYHRCKALELMGSETVYATIRSAKNWEDVVAQRIRATKTHTVRFPRIIEWVTDAWSRTEWAQKKDITAKTAFSLGFNTRMSGKMLGLTPDETTEIRTWVVDSSTAWETAAGTIYKYLRMAEMSNPELVKATREQQNGRGEARLTPHHLQVIARAFPDQINYEFQAYVARVVTDKALRVAQTRSFVEALKVARVSRNPSEEIARVSKGAGLTDIMANPLYTPDQQRRMIQKKEALTEAATTDPYLIDRLLEASLRIAVLSIENTIMRPQKGSHDTVLTGNTARSLFGQVAKKVRPEALPYIAAIMSVQDPEAMFKRTAPEDGGPEPLPPAFIEGIKYALPRLSFLEEQALVLTAFFNLPRAATARILNVDDAMVGFLLERAQGQLPKTVKRLQLPAES